MGVIQCNRKGCTEIMCQTQIPGIGNICYDCKKEFTDQMSYQELPEREMFSKLREFMNTEREQGSDEQVNAWNFFRKYEKD